MVKPKYIVEPYTEKELEGMELGDLVSTLIDLRGKYACFVKERYSEPKKIGPPDEPNCVTETNRAHDKQLWGEFEVEQSRLVSLINEREKIYRRSSVVG